MKKRIATDTPVNGKLRCQKMTCGEGSKPSASCLDYFRMELAMPKG